MTIMTDIECEPHRRQVETRESEPQRQETTNEHQLTRIGGGPAGLAPVARKGSGSAGASPYQAKKTREIQGEDWRLKVANDRLGKVEAYLALTVGQGKSPRIAAREVGVNRITIWRWAESFKQDGFEGLIPKKANCGRESIAEKLGLTIEEINSVKGLHLDTESGIAAWRMYAQSNQCREELAAAILGTDRPGGRTSKHSIPPSLRAATKVTENEKKAHRGPRKLALEGIWTPRKLDILPGDIFTSDDTTPIWAWWVPWIECDEYPYGCKVLQGQFLPVIDVASQCCIAFVLIARESASYRAADIWGLFGHVFDSVGLPRLGWQLERGSWEAKVIKGEELEWQEGEVSVHRRVGGLRSLPSHVTDWHTREGGPLQVGFPSTLQTWTSYLPKSKSIEAFFNRSQTLEGTLWGCLGRDQMRNPYEKTKKIYEACKRGSENPRNHFLSQTEILGKIRKMLDYLNNEPMEGEVFRGVPRLLFENAVGERPLFRMPEDKRYLYRRSWKTAAIEGGWARVRATDEITGKRYSLFYSNPHVFAAHPGEKIVIYYDRENYEEPAQIHLARTGEFLCEATYEDRRGSFLDGDLTGHEVRKAWRHAVMSAYSTLMPYAPSRQLPAEIAARRKAEETTNKHEGTRIEPEPLTSILSPEGRGSQEAQPAYQGNVRMRMLEE